MGRDFPSVVLQDVPAWYQLGLTERGGIRILISDAAMQRLPDALSGFDFRTAVDVFGTEFVPPTETEKEWGIGGTLRLTNSPVHGWVCYDCVFPKGGANVALESRGGLGEISYTLNALFTALGRCGSMDDSGERCQLLTVDYLGNSFGGSRYLGMYGVKASISLPLDRWLVSLGDVALSESLDAMKGMIKLVCHSDLSEVYIPECRAFNGTEGGLYLTLGDAQDLSVGGEYRGPDSGFGYELVPHNIDAPSMQLALLAALAALDQAARAAGAGLIV